MIPRSILAFCLACFVAWGTDAWSLPLSGEDAYRVTHWAAGDDGLPQNSAKVLAQSGNGYLWVGTLNGLARFDGLRFEVFDHNNTPALISEAIDQLVVDAKDDSLWVQSRDRLIHFNNHSFEPVAPGPDLAGVRGAICKASAGGVWCSTSNGELALVGQGQIRKWSLDPERKLHLLGAIELNRKVVLLRLNLQLYEFDLEQSSLRPAAMPTNTGTCYCMTDDGAGKLWIATDSGIWTGTAGNWKLASALQSTEEDPNVRLYLNSHGCFRTGRRPSDGNPILERLDSATGKFVPTAFGDLPQPTEVSKILEDREGNLWMGSSDGVFRLQRKSLRVFSRKNGLRNDEILAVAASSDGNLWMGTHNGVSGIFQGVLTNLPEPRGWQYGVGVLWPERDGSVLCGSIEGFFRQWPDGRRENFLCEDGEKGCPIKAAFKDSHDRLWTSSGESVLCYENGREKRFSRENGLTSADIRVFFEDRKGNIWAGSYGQGLFRFDPDHDRFIGYSTDRGEYNNRAWWIHEDTDGVFWIGSQDGLNRFENGHFFTFTRQHGLFENVVNNIQEDEFGQLWLSGLNGIYQVSRRELNEVAAGRQSRMRCIAYGEAEGMLSRECNGGDNQPGGCKDKQGRIYFATARGVVIINPAEAPQNNVPPSAIVEEMKLDGRMVVGYPASSTPGAKPARMNHSTPESFPPGAGNLIVSYTGVSLSAPEKVRFKYQLRGIDSKWIDAGTRRAAYYHNLPPGDYTFEVMAVNSYGIWSKSSGRVAFALLPHFYQTRSFYLVCAGLVIAAIGALQAYRLKWQRRLMQIEQQRALAQERARIARDLHDDLGTALTGLALELDVAEKAAGSGASLDGRLAQTAQRTRDLAERMREVVWTVNPRCDTVSSLADFLEQQVTQFLRAPGVSIRLNFPEDIPALALGADARHQLALSAREALANVVRHSQATEVNVRLSIGADSVELEIQDNGRGFDSAAVNGNGLGNMHARMSQAGGKFECLSRAGAGTTLRFRVPLNSGVAAPARARPVVGQKLPASS